MELVLVRDSCGPFIRPVPAQLMDVLICPIATNDLGHSLTWLASTSHPCICLASWRTTLVAWTGWGAMFSSTALFLLAIRCFHSWVDARTAQVRPSPLEGRRIIARKTGPADSRGALNGLEYLLLTPVRVFSWMCARVQEVRGRDRPQRVLAQAQGDRRAGGTAPHPRHQRRRQAQCGGGRLSLELEPAFLS